MIAFDVASTRPASSGTVGSTPVSRTATGPVVPGGVRLRAFAATAVCVVGAAGVSTHVPAIDARRTGVFGCTAATPRRRESRAAKRSAVVPRGTVTLKNPTPPIRATGRAPAGGAPSPDVATSTSDTGGAAAARGVPTPAAPAPAATSPRDTRHTPLIDTAIGRVYQPWRAP